MIMIFSLFSLLDHKILLKNWLNVVLEAKAKLIGGSVSPISIGSNIFRVVDE